MEVVSTSNLLSSETEKTTTACNFQTMTMNSFVISHDLMRGQIGGHANERLLICSFMMVELWKSALRNISTQNSKIKTDQQWVERKNVFYFENAFFCDNLIKPKEVWWSISCKTTNKPCENNEKTIRGVFLLTTWLIGVKYLKQITLYDTNAVMLLTIVIISDT